MKIYRSFIKEIKSEDIKGIYLLYGSESFLLDKALAEIKTVVVSGFPELNYIVFQGKGIDLSDLENACETLPFASDKKLVVVKDFSGLSSKKKKGKDEHSSSSENLEEPDQGVYPSFIEDLSRDTCLLFINKGQVDKRKKLFKEIKKIGSVFEFKSISRSDLHRWIENAFSNADKEIEQREIQHLIQNSGYLDKDRDVDLYQLKNQIEKIIAFMGEDKVLNMQHMKPLLREPLENNVFKLIEASYDRKIETSLRIFNDLILEGESSYSIIYLISWGVKNLIKVKELKKQGLNSRDISRKIKLNEFVVKNYMKHCDKFDDKSLNNAFENCLKCEKDLKSGRVEERLSMEILLTLLFYP